MRSFALVVVLLSLACADPSSVNPLAPQLRASSDTLVFGEVFIGARPTLPLALESVGNAGVRVLSVRVPGAFRLELEPRLVAAGERIDLEIVFAPEAAGANSATLVIETDSAERPRIEVALSGEGLEPPQCDDGDPCTADRFVPDLGTCASAPLDDVPCDDGNACSENDRCDDGVCRGDALTCTDGVSCTRDVCDPVVGCTFVPDHGACADEDPCTLNTCSPTGCVNPPAPDYTPCGGIEHCVTVDLCLGQVCTAVDIPEGAPCSDGDVCTTADTCEAGLCVGSVDPAAGEPEVVETLAGFTEPGSERLRRGDLLISMGYAYVALGFGEARVGPRPVTPLGFAGTDLLMDVDGRFAVTADWSRERYFVLDLAEPLTPVVTGSFTMPAWSDPPVGVAANAALFCEDNELRQVPLTDGVAGEPVFVAGGCDPLLSAAAYKVVGERLVVLRAAAGAFVVDVFTVGVAGFTLRSSHQTALPSSGNVTVHGTRELIGFEPTSLARAVMVDLRSDAPVVSALDAFDVVAVSASEILSAEADGALYLRHVDAPAFGDATEVVIAEGLVGNTPRALYFDGDWLVLAGPGPVRAFRRAPEGGHVFNELPIEDELQTSIIPYSNSLRALGGGWLETTARAVTRFLPPAPDGLGAAAVTRIEPDDRVLDVEGVRSLRVHRVATGEFVEGIVVADGVPLSVPWLVTGAEELTGIAAQGEGCTVTGTGDIDGLTHFVTLDTCLGQAANPPEVRVLGIGPRVQSRDFGGPKNHDGFVSVERNTGMALYELSELGGIDEVAFVTGANTAGFDAGSWVTTSSGLADQAPVMRVKVLEIEGGGATHLGELTVAEVEPDLETPRVLGVFWPLAVVTTNTRVLLINVDGGVTLIGELPFKYAQSAAVEGDRLAIVHVGGLSVISPPCP